MLQTREVEMWQAVQRSICAARICSRGQVSGGPGVIQPYWEALGLPFQRQVVDACDYLQRVRHATVLGRLWDGYRFARQVLRHLDGVSLTAPNEVAFHAWTDARTPERYEFFYAFFVYRFALRHRYLQQITIEHDFDQFPADVQDWIVKIVEDHFSGTLTPGVAIDGSKEAWERVTQGKFTCKPAAP